MCGGRTKIYTDMCVDADLLLEREREPFETERYKSTTKETISHSFGFL